MSNLVIVESPAKAKTINKYLGKDYEVIASYGHIRDLPSKDGSVKPNEDFAMTYEISAKSEKHVKTIAQAFKKADKIFLATDPDREGESISWHIIEAMREKKALKKNTIIKRVVFNEITKKAVIDAISHPGEINQDLVNAQQARRALDYLYGFTLSPVLWRKLPGSKSAGRVQSVALRIICEREDEIEKFTTQEYWSIHLDFITENKEKLSTYLTHYEGKKLEKFDLNNKEAVEKVVTHLEKEKYQVQNIEKKQISRNPQPPFITSSLQQEASRKLGFSAKYTMQIAQKLYEGVDIRGETIGLITYMRTDGVQLAAEAVDACRKFIEKDFGSKYLPKSPRVYKSKAKNAQEAHEAIRPTYINYTPKSIKSELESDQFKLYELIWKRTVACQMENAILDQVTISISGDTASTMLRAVGSTLAFDGFYKLYREGLDDSKEEEDKLLPKVNIGENLTLEEIKPNQHFTEPPPRYAEASLVKKLEELGIGRPSTYASIISVLQEREYVKLDKKRFIPEERGRLVTAFLVSFFKRYVEYDFTASLEDQLDHVSSGELNWKELLKQFWHDFEINATETKNLEPTKVVEAINILLENHFFPKDEHGHSDKKCPSCDQGELSIKLGKFGPFAACSNYPDCKYTKALGSEASNSENNEDSTNEGQLNNELGIDSATGLGIYIKKGPYGHYIQLGEDGKGKDKPKRVPVPNFIDAQNIDIETAKSLISLPKELGVHPETIQPISVGIGKFGPYLLHAGKYTSLNKGEDFLNISFDQALNILSNKTVTKSSSDIVKSLGNHPEEGSEIAIYSGRYGPYIKYKKTNAPIPKKMDINTISLIDALNILKEHEEKKAAKG